MRGRWIACFSLTQPKARSYSVNVDGDELATGRRAPGWALFQRSGQTVGVAVRDFWRQFPKGIEVNEQGDLVVHLWKAGAQPLVTGGGEAKRHELYLAFGDDGGALQGLLHPLRAVAPALWYSETKGFVRPLLLVEPEQLPLFPPSLSAYEDFVETGYADLMRSREINGDYGWRNYGDWSTTWDPDGWGNTEYDLSHVYFLQFARTGDLRYFELAESAARHWMDVDIIWAAHDVRWLGIGLRHSTQHRSGNIEPAHTWLQGLVDYYHLTGDRRSLEAAQLSGDGFARWALQGHPHLAPKSVPRTAGWMLIGLMYLYESTLDPHYLQAAEVVVGVLAAGQDPDGQWTHRMASTEVEGNPMRSKPFMTAVVLRGLADYHRVTKEPRAAEMIVRGSEVLVDKYWSETARGFPYITDEPQYPPRPSTGNLLLLEGFTYAYQLTGDEKYLRVARLGFDSGIEASRRSLGAPNSGKLVAQSLRHTAQTLVYLMEPKPLALMPTTPQLGPHGFSDAGLSFVRLNTEGPMEGVLQITDTSEGLEFSWSEYCYAFAPGERSVQVPLSVRPRKTLAPGTYSYTVHDPMHPELSSKVAVKLPGWRVVDELRPSMTNTFFGTLDWRLTSDESDGWAYATEDAQRFDSDATRLRRKANTHEYLIYDEPGLFDFKVTFYLPAGSEKASGTQVQAAISVDQGPWVALMTECTWEKGSDDADAIKVVMTPCKEERYYRGEARLRVSVQGGEDPAFPQIGRIEISGWKKP
ncbi:MAG: hypothetical protein ACOX4G_10235 [Limnochordia bacterium]